MKIYTVSTIDTSDEIIKHSICTPGIFTKLENAVYSVKNNEKNISEDGNYEFCVIEESELDVVHPDGLNRMWFRWDTDDEEYKPCTVPAQYKSLSNLAIV